METDGMSHHTDDGHATDGEHEATQHRDSQEDGRALEPQSAVAARTSHRGHALLAARQMDDAETALEVDHMMLDFLLFQAINACLAGSTSATLPHAHGGSHVDICLFQVDQFLRLFRGRYPSYRPDGELRFRQLLLQLVTLTSQRFVRCPSTPPRASLRALRDRNQARARDWIGVASRVPTVHHNVQPFDNALPIPTNYIDENRAQVLHSLGREPEDDAYEDAFYGTSESVALLDILPTFMRASAACHRMFQCPPTEKWMRLAAGLMLQASLEQYMVYGSSGSDALDEAFAWGPKRQQEERERDDVMAEDTTQDAMDEDPFCQDMDPEDVELWNAVKAQALQAILSTEKQYWKDIASHLAAVWDQHPLANMEAEIAEFLQDLAVCIPEPTLVQLQRGQLQGMSREETKRFIDGCGVDVAEILTGRDAGH